MKSQDHSTTLQKVRATIETYSMIEPGSSVLAAVSGGADSVALIHLLFELSAPLNFDLSVAHLNHSLRGDQSDGDQEFVAGLAAGLGLEFLCRKVDVRALAESKKLSIEEAAREARRDFLMKTASQKGYATIATGHHGDDQAETVLLRLIRGAGVRGLAGIEPSSREGYIRPLIACERKELRAYLNERHIEFREDSSNLDTSFLRNRIRHDLLPAIERNFNPSITRVLRRTAANMAEVEGLLLSLGAKVFKESLLKQDADTMSLDSKQLRTYDKVVWGYVFRRAYGILAGDSFSLTRAHIQALADLVEKSPSGTAIHLPGEIRAGVEYGAVSIHRHRPRPASRHCEKEVLLPGITEFPELGGSLAASLIEAGDLPEEIGAGDPAVVYFDLEDISPPLKLRTRRRGDRIRLFGSGGTKKLKDLMIDLKIRPDARDTTPVIEDGRGLLWLVGFKRSDRARVTGATKKALALKWSKTD